MRSGIGPRALTRGPQVAGISYRGSPGSRFGPWRGGGRRSWSRLDTDPSDASRSRSTWVLLGDAFVRASELRAVGVARTSSIARGQTIIRRHVAGKEKKKRNRDHGKRKPHGPHVCRATGSVTQNVTPNNRSGQS